VTARDTGPDAHDITCRQAVALMTDYLDGVLGADDRALIEAHLGECEGCAEHLRQFRITVAVTGGIGEEDLDPAAREDLMEIYRRWRATVRPSLPRSRPRTAGPGARRGRAASPAPRRPSGGGGACRTARAARRFAARRAS